MCQKIFGLVLALSLLAVTTAQAIGLEASIGLWQQSLSGDIAYEPISDSDTIDINDLQIDDETRVFGRVKIDMPLFIPNIYVLVAPAEFEGEGRRSVDFSYGGTRFRADGLLKSKVTMNQYDIGLYYGLPFIETASLGVFNVDVGLNLRVLDLKATLEGELQAQGNVAQTGEESESISVPVPMLYLGAQFMPTEKFMIEAETRSLSVGGNSLLSLIGRVRYKFTGPLFVAGGYRYDKLDVDEDDVIADMDISGLFLELGFAF